MPRKKVKILKGRKLPQTKLTERDILGIYYTYFEEGIPQAEIARLYGVHRSTISLIIRGLRRSESAALAAKSLKIK